MLGARTPKLYFLFLFVHGDIIVVWVCWFVAGLFLGECAFWVFRGRGVIIVMNVYVLIFEIYGNESAFWLVIFIRLVDVYVFGP